MDFRVGKIVEVENLEGSENLYKELIDIGTEKKNIASGLRKYIPIENMRE